MDFKSVLTHIDIDARPDQRVVFSLAFANGFGADLTCLSAAEPLLMLEPDFGTVSGGEIMREETAAIEARQRSHHQHLMRHAPFQNHVRWEAMIADPTASLIERACSADLIVLYDLDRGQARDYRRTVNVSDVLLSAGRPVLLPSVSMASLKGNTIVIAWKDTKEARRAVVDAMPILRRAEDVIAVSIGEKGAASQRALADIVQFLVRHNIRARSVMEPGQSRDTGAALVETAAELGADLVVAGAYGHTRFREWAFGGVTHSLLRNTSINRLMSN